MPKKLRWSWLCRLVGRKKKRSRDAAIPTDNIRLERRPLAYEEMIKDARNSGPRFLVLSGCQGKMISGFLEILTMGQSTHHFMGASKMKAFQDDGWEFYKEAMDAADFIYTQKTQVADFLASKPEYCDKVLYFPVIASGFFHPDISYMRYKGELFAGPVGDYHSVLITASYFAGLTQGQALNCFHPDVYEIVGFCQKAKNERKAFLENFDRAGIDLSEVVMERDKDGPWMRTLNHPKPQMIYDVVKRVLERDGLSIRNQSASAVEWVEDNLAQSAEWPLYPGIHGEPVENVVQARQSMLFKSPYRDLGKGLMFDLEKLIYYTYVSLSKTQLKDVSLNNFDLHKAIKAVRCLWRRFMLIHRWRFCVVTMEMG
nr:WcbI family polysaccharide biosynthesis putative acetyltransferase [Ectothiorhodospira lacustris]